MFWWEQDPESGKDPHEGWELSLIVYSAGMRPSTGETLQDQILPHTHTSYDMLEEASGNIHCTEFLRSPLGLKFHDYKETSCSRT